MKKVKVGIIGLGCRGISLLKHVILRAEGVEVVAVCDIYADRVDEGAKLVVKAGGKEPIKTADYKDVLASGIDAVFILCSWSDHTAIALDAMRAGIYVGLEVGGAYKLDDCFDLVAVSEETGVPCMMLENCCYGKYELAVLNAVRQGVFGKVVYASGGYHHDLRHEIAFGRENRHYRLNEYLTRNCENYPTHELGPIARVLDINRGNRMTSLTSFSSPARGMHDFVLKHKSDDVVLAEAEFKQGDIVTTVIECARGENIVLTLDTTLPRTYSRGFTVRGTQAGYSEDGNLFWLDGSKKMRAAEFVPSILYGNGRRFVKKYEHPIWTESKGSMVKAGHGGMDWLVINAFLEAVRLSEQTPIDVYDSASLMAVTALSDMSIKAGNTKIEFPDFTKGNWEKSVPALKNKFRLD